MNQKGFQSIILVIALLLVIAGSFYFFKNTLNEKTPDPEFSANQNLQKRVESPNISRILYSGEKKYSLLIEIEYSNDGTSVSCTKTIFNNQGSEIVSSRTSNFLRDITCNNGMQVSLDGIKNFSGDNIVFNLLGTNITIFNIPTGKVESLTYNIGEGQRDYNLFAVDTDLKYMLFSKDGYAFIDQVKDYEGKEIFNIQPLLNLGSNDIITSYFDPVNHGILYLRQDSAQRKGYQFTYFDLKTKKMKNLKFMPKNPDSVGRGCSGNYLYPEMGKLVFVGGCLDIENNPSGEIILDL